MQLQKGQLFIKFYHLSTLLLDLIDLIIHHLQSILYYLIPKLTIRKHLLFLFKSN